MEEKSCTHCSKKLVGRTDKKFCNNYCRSSFHNDQLGNRTNYIRRINYLLQKNRQILAASYSIHPAKKPIPLSTLFIQGFSAMHFTHQEKNQRNDTFIFCYDYGYRKVGRNAVQIVQQANI